jgi:hypothetical protein
MCFTYGCHSPPDSPGDTTNITLAILAAAADVVGISAVQVAHNLRDTLPILVPGLLLQPHCDIDGVLAIQPEASINAVNATMGANPASGAATICTLRQAVEHGYPLIVHRAHSATNSLAPRRSPSHRNVVSQIGDRLFEKATFMMRT